MTRAVILGRVSTDDQAEEGTGLPGQIEAALRYIEQRGYTLDTTVGYASDGIAFVPGVFQEDYTGKVIYRPAVNHLLDALEKRGIKVVVVHRTSRLGRRGSVQEALEALFKERGARTEFVTAQFDTSTATGRAMRRISGVFDELDYENIIEQLKEGKVQRVKAGSVLMARPPYGYKVIKARDEAGKRVTLLQVVEEEERIVHLIYEWYVYDDLSMNAIAQRLTEMRVPTRGDGQGGNRRKYPAGVWADAVVRQILNSETYIGRWHYNKTKVVPVAGTNRTKQVPRPREEWLCVPVPPIVTDDRFEAARDKAKRNAELSKRNRKYTYLFAGMLSCRVCERSYVGQLRDDDMPRYRCGSRRSRYTYLCEMPNFTEREIDAVVWPWIGEIANDFEKVERTLLQQQHEEEAQNARFNAMIATTDRLIAEKRAEQARVLDLFKKGKLDEERWEVEDSVCQKEIASHEADRAKLVAQLAQPRYTPEYLADVRLACEMIGRGFANFTAEEKRRTYELLDLRVQLAVEERCKVAHASCVLDVKRLLVKEAGVIGNTSSLQRECNRPIRLSARLVIGPVRHGQYNTAKK
jgi:site-specific DNA recombinase